LKCFSGDKKTVIFIVAWRIYQSNSVPPLDKAIKLGVAGIKVLKNQEVDVMAELKKMASTQPVLSYDNRIPCDSAIGIFSCSS